MLLRIALYLILAYFFFRLFNSFLAGQRRRRNLRNRYGSREADEMVLDPQCKSYLPKGEAIQRNGQYFCSEECARLYLSR